MQLFIYSDNGCFVCIVVQIWCMVWIEVCLVFEQKWQYRCRLCRWCGLLVRVKVLMMLWKLQYGFCQRLVQMFLLMIGVQYCMLLWVGWISGQSLVSEGKVWVSVVLLLLMFISLVLQVSLMVVVLGSVLLDQKIILIGFCGVVRCCLMQLWVLIILCMKLILLQFGMVILQLYWVLKFLFCLVSCGCQKNGWLKVWLVILILLLVKMCWVIGFSFLVRCGYMFFGLILFLIIEIEVRNGQGLMKFFSICWLVQGLLGILVWEMKLLLSMCMVVMCWLFLVVVLGFGSGIRCKVLCRKVNGLRIQCWCLLFFFSIQGVRVKLFQLVVVIGMYFLLLFLSLSVGVICVGLSMVSVGRLWIWIISGVLKELSSVWLWVLVFGLILSFCDSW